MAKIVFLFVLFFTSGCLAFEQYFTLYSEPNYKGDSLMFRSKQPNTADLNRFFGSSQSYEARGYWRIYSGSQYTDSVHYILSSDGTGGFPNWSFPYGASVRHAGPLETTVQSISFYSLTSLNGVEHVITQPASNDIPFSPASILSTGRSNWTLFTGSNFDGTASCYVSNQEIHYLSSVNKTLSNVRSIIKGCLGRIDTFLFANDFDVRPKTLL